MNDERVFRSFDLTALQHELNAQGRSAVRQWQPKHCGRIDIRIDSDGNWHHEGTAIRRTALVRLFASVLRREGDDYFLVTPVEKMQIQVDDVPFMVVAEEFSQNKLYLMTQVEDTVEVGPQRPLFARVGADGSLNVYIEIRDRLDAKLNRSVYYRLMERLCEREHKGQPCLGVEVDGFFFPLMNQKQEPVGDAGLEPATSAV